MWRSLLLFCIFPLAGACDSDNAVTGNSSLPALVTVDMISGFEEKSIRIEFDGQRYFSAYPSGMSPFSGPQMSFITALERGEHLLAVEWRAFNESLTIAHRDSAHVEIGDQDSYHIGLRLYPDSLWVAVQSRPFGYL